MKDRESRDAAVARATTALKKYPHFTLLPEVSKYDFASKVQGNTEADYHNAMYVVCANGDVLGRDGDRVVGKKREDVENVTRAAGGTARMAIKRTRT